MECMQSTVKWISMRVINILRVSNGQRRMMMKSRGLPLERNGVTQVMSRLQVFVILKDIFPLQGAIVIQMWTLLWHVVLKRKRRKKKMWRGRDRFVLGVFPKILSVKKQNSKNSISECEHGLICVNSLGLVYSLKLGFYIKTQLIRIKLTFQLLLLKFLQHNE